MTPKIFSSNISTKLCRRAASIRRSCRNISTRAISLNDIKRTAKKWIWKKCERFVDHIFLIKIEKKEYLYSFFFFLKDAQTYVNTSTRNSRVVHPFVTIDDQSWRIRRTNRRSDVIYMGSPLPSCNEFSTTTLEVIEIIIALANTTDYLWVL